MQLQNPASVISYDFLLFDFDGTIADTRPAIAHSLGACCEQMGCKKPPHERLLELVGTGLTLSDTLERMHAELSISSSDIQLQKWILTYREIYLSEGKAFVRPFPGVRELFSGLTPYRESVRTIILSNKGVRAVQEAIALFEIVDVVWRVLGEEPSLPTKPDPRVFDFRIAPLVGIADRARMLMIGDAEPDIKFAQNCGLHSCWVEYGYGTRGPLTPTHQVKSPTEILSLVFGVIL